MLLRSTFLIALVLCLAAPSASAQDVDDLLAPLTPSAKGKGKTATKHAKPQKTSKAPVTKTGKGAKTAKNAKGKQPAPTVDASQPDDLLAPLVAKTELLVKVNGVRGARLLIDDKDVGLAAKGSVEVTPGEHSVVVRRPGYRDYSKRVTAAEGQITEVNVLLEAVAGFVTVKADVVGAHVLINGEDKGAAPLEGLLLPAGTYDIVVQHEGFRPESQRIAVRAGKEYTVDVSLRPEAVAQSDQPRTPLLTPKATVEPTSSPLVPEPTPTVSTSTPLTKRWYFWAGVGAVAVAAAVGTYAATQPAALDPNKVCGGACDAVINKPATSGGLHF